MPSTSWLKPVVASSCVACLFLILGCTGSEFSGRSEDQKLEPAKTEPVGEAPDPVLPSKTISKPALPRIDRELVNKVDAETVPPSTEVVRDDRSVLNGNQNLSRNIKTPDLYVGEDLTNQGFDLQNADIGFPLKDPVIESGELGDTPLVLDWDRDGKITTAAKAVPGGVDFDIDGNDLKEKVEWISAEESFLAIDLNGNGRIDSGRELFGNAARLADGSRANHGFEALAVYDKNRDGRIDRTDPVFDSLLLWQDLNLDGISQSHELKKLSTTDVVALHVRYRTLHGDERIIAGGKSKVGLKSWYETLDGSRFDLVDVFFYVERNELVLMNPQNPSPAPVKGAMP